MQEQDFPKRLSHEVPGWVRGGGCFHIRLRAERQSQRLLTEPEIAKRLIESAKYYHEHERWFCWLFLVMPDHLHAMITFPMEARMSQVIGAWKCYAARTQGVCWQSNYFDHRLRNEREADETFEYILQNPAAKGLCSLSDVWPWQFRCDEMP